MLTQATQQDTGFDLINLMEEVALGLQKNATISLPDTSRLFVYIATR